MHRKLVTGENLLKRGFLGPYRCCFCLQAVETLAHIFVGFIFALEVWAHFLLGLPYSFVPLNSEPDILFKNWYSRYPCSLPASHEWRKIWQAIPKFLWWKIWLARNDSIFNSKVTKSKIVAIKAKALLLELVGNFQIDSIKFEAEHRWLGSLLVDKIQLGLGRPVFKPSWKVRTTEKEFSEWWQKKNKVSIFFDGASKGNLGKVGARGIDFLPKRKVRNQLQLGSREPRRIICSSKILSTRKGSWT